MSAPQGRSAVGAETFAVVVNALLFLVIVGAVIAISVVAAVSDTPIAEHPWTAWVLGLIAASAVAEVIGRVFVRRARKRARRAPLPVVVHADAPAERPTTAVLIGEIPRFERVIRGDIIAFVVLFCLFSPWLFWFRFSATPVDWARVGPYLGIVFGVSVGGAILAIVVRATVRGLREVTLLRRLPTAVVFTTRRTEALDEALRRLDAPRPRSDVVIAVEDRGITLWSAGRLIVDTPWNSVVDARPGRVSTGSWPMPRSGRAIVLRVVDRAAEVEVPLAPIAAFPFGRAHANRVLDEFRIRTRVVPARTPGAQPRSR